MRPITDIRRDRLRQLIDEVAEGNQAKFAEMIGKSRAYVGFWLTNPAKPHAKQISHDQARGVEEEMRRRGNRQYVAGWLDAAAESQPATLDVARLGPALTAIDRVIRGRGRPVEGQLGKYPALLLYAYELQDDEKLFPNGITATSPKRELNRYDKLLDKYLGGMIADEEAERT